MDASEAEKLFAQSQAHHIPVGFLGYLYKGLYAAKEVWCHIFRPQDALFMTKTGKTRIMRPLQAEIKVEYVCPLISSKNRCRHSGT